MDTLCQALGLLSAVAQVTFVLGSDSLGEGQNQGFSDEGTNGGGPGRGLALPGKESCGESRGAGQTLG